jgi:hypothetical protein
MNARRMAIPASLLLAIASGACGGTAQSGKGAPQLAAVHRDTVACQYILAVYSPLAQAYPNGFHAADMPQKVAAASSAVLRGELAAWSAAKASRNYAVSVQEGGAMVKTCYQLGLSNVDRMH